MNHRYLKTGLLLLFFPLSFLWEWVHRIRRIGYHYGVFKQNHFKVPIISVGNITFGGTGKTPFTLWLGDYFESQGKRVMILMRGYKGELEKRSGILRGDTKLGYNPFEFGDEALVLARRLRSVSIVVGKNRSSNLKHYFHSEKPEVVLLDDGHQHLKIGRDLNFILFDAMLPMASYMVAPSGYLREGLDALNDADGIIVTRCDQVPESKVDALIDKLRSHIHGNVPVARTAYHSSVLKDTQFKRVMDVSQLKGKKVICVAGIASPASFFQSMESYGAEVIDCLTFPDHHQFRASEVSRILQTAEREDALVVTTEKDIVKIRRITNDKRFLYLEIELRFLSGQEAICNKIKGVV
jgi:tetraacyldisaccharide 4'-kinase